MLHFQRNWKTIVPPFSLWGDGRDETMGICLLNRLKSGKFFHKPIQANHVHFRKGYGFQYPEVGILADNIIGTCHYGTIHKLVVIRVLLNKTEAEMRSKEPRERAAYDGIYDVVGDGCICHALYYFLIFIHNVIGHTVRIFLHETPAMPHGRDYVPTAFAPNN